VPVPKSQLEAIIRQAEASLAPADPKTIAALLDQTLELYGLPDNWDRVVGFYLEAFEGVPVDLVAAALKRVRQTCRFFPKPAELRAPIREEWAKRRQALVKLQIARGLAKEPEPERTPPTPEQVARVRAMVAGIAQQDIGDAFGPRAQASPEAPAGLRQSVSPAIARSAHE
jgi:hypothetical protein